MFAGFALAISGRAPAIAQAEPRLLTGLSAQAGPVCVEFAWTVDECRADRIALVGDRIAQVVWSSDGLTAQVAGFYGTCSP